VKKIKAVQLAGMLGLVLNTAHVYAGNGDLIVNGNLGVGTVTPTAKLEVDTLSSGTTSLAAKFLNPTSSQSGVQILIGLFTDSYMSSISAAGYPSLTYASDLWLRPRKSDSTLGLGVYISPNDYVGIGSTTPGAKLEVDTFSTASTSLALKISNPNTNQAGVQMLIGPYTDSFMSSISATGYPYLTYGTDLWLRSRKYDSTLGNGIYISPGDFVGIGTINPQHALDVNGEVWANGLKLTSDARFKKNIIPVQNALETLLKIEGVSYEWKKPEEYLDSQITTASINSQSEADQKK